MADRSLAGIVLGVAALVGAAAAVVVARDAKRDAEEHTAAAAAASSVAASPAEAGRSPPVLERAPTDDRLAKTVEELKARLARVEGRVGLGPRAADDDGKDAPASPPSPAAPTAATLSDADRADHDALREKVLAGKATGEERRRFWMLARAAGTVDSTVAALEQALAASPDDAAARMRLADGYVSKLFLVPMGPEKGIWAAKAEAQWSAVLERDERHWDARFSLAFGYSQYPDFLNKVPDSIREFETLRRFQEQSAPEPRQAQVYVQLASLYRRQASAEKARQVLEAGLARHPDDEEIRKALDGAKR